MHSSGGYLARGLCCPLQTESAGTTAGKSANIESNAAGKCVQALAKDVTSGAELPRVLDQ
jgi:hypothetical protein